MKPRAFSSAFARWVPCVLLLLLTGAGSFAEASGNKPALAFEHTSKDLHLALGERESIVLFPFQNNGADPVSIAGVKSSCGCTVPELAKKTYVPGEFGEIKVHYKASGVLPEATRRIAVLIEGGEPQTLTINVKQDVGAKLSSKSEQWRIGATPDAREISVEVHDQAFHIVEVSSSNDAFDVFLKTDEPRKQYSIKVQPLSTALPARGTVRIRTDHPAVSTLIVRLEVL